MTQKMLFGEGALGLDGEAPERCWGQSPAPCIHAGCKKGCATQVGGSAPVFAEGLSPVIIQPG